MIGGKTKRKKMFEILFDLVVRWINAESFLFDQTRGKKKERKGG
jgi:hypothetical protein